jgi:hypothetical protein
MKKPPINVVYLAFFILFLALNPKVFGKIRCDGNCNEVMGSKSKQNLDAEPSAPREQASVEEQNKKITPTDLPAKKRDSQSTNKKTSKHVRHFDAVGMQSKSKNSNLPEYYFDESRSPFIVSEEKNQTSWFIERETGSPKPKSLYPGKSAFIEISQDIVATPNVPSPIKAQIKDGDLEGAIIFGEAKLEDDLNRVLISFKSLRYEDETYSIQARVIDHMGAVGVKGEYIAENRGVIAGGFLSTFFSVFADSSVERHRNEQGNYVDEPIISNAAKKGLSGALAKSADRMMDRAQRMPGYTVVKGPTLVQVIFDDTEATTKR